ncbi:MAG TPA: TIGR01906 family membrane protein [Chloroflexi bacterium]|nr:MAG: TIGR01906 family membrane protein [Chloroflexota bacterium]HDD56095.1 TIGR01906 family membrane protein [Chloroflexota bacterium]
MKTNFKIVLNFLVTLSIPLILSTLSILVLLSPVFTTLEYRRPGFPEDSYGFSTEERLDFGNKTRRYLITNQSLDALRQLEFEDGDPIYEERELTHLEDVKVVIQGFLRVFYAAVVVSFCGAYVAHRYQWQEEYNQALFRGGRLTSILLLTVLFFTLISFRALFTGFHRVFFEGESWLFYYSDTLIRLFPIRFWQDVFLIFGLLTLAGGGTLGWGIPALRKSTRAKADNGSIE